MPVCSQNDQVIRSAGSLFCIVWKWQPAHSLMAVAHIQVLCFTIIGFCITSNVHAGENTENKVSPTFIRTSAFLPQSKAELKSAVEACLALSPKGDCFDGPHGAIGEWDVSRVTNMSRVFAYSHSFNANICEWDVSSVTSMNRMFLAATTFTGDISKWDVSRVTDMDGMFWDAVAFHDDISNWNVSSVISMSHMFVHGKFNGDISKWDVSRVTDIQGMFSGNSAFNGDISEWDVSRVANMSLTFKNAKSFNVDLSKWNVSRVTDMNYMFAGTPSFTHKLCGSAWITSNASQSNTFLGSLGSIPPNTHCINTTSFSPQSRTELKGVLDACVRPRPLPRIIAHRGGSRIGPENTKGALLNALRMEVDPKNISKKY